jgi:hypothetical protein
MRDRTMVKVGDFITGGPPASGQALTKVYAANAQPTIDETDEKFDEADRLQAVLEKTRKAIEALKTKI